MYNEFDQNITKEVTPYDKLIAHSIRFLYQHFLSGITEKSLNVFYYACSYAKVDYSRFMNTTARIALKLIPHSLRTQPIFLYVDDTMVSKFGTKFENVSKLFDHAAHNGSNYLNGHCFVSIILCDSWYTKQNLVSIVDKYPNLDLIGNARIDSVMYDLAPARTGRRGRPAKHGKQLYIETDFTFSDEKITDYYIGVRRVLTKIFGSREVLAYVTATEKEQGTKRLFFSEQKTFWSLCNYMVRSCKGIETLVNLINISYCAMKILPYQNEYFSGYRTKSVQEIRFELSEGIRNQIFFVTFVKNIETHIKSNAMIKALKQLVHQQVYHL